MSEWNKPRNSVRAEPKKKTGVFRGIVAGLAVLATVGMAVWLYCSNDSRVDDDRSEKRPARISTVKPSIAAVNKVEVEESVESAETVRHSDAVVVTARSSRVGRVMKLMDGTVITNKPTSIFERDFERGLMVALRPGGMTWSNFARLRAKYSDEQILSMLKELTIPKDSDTDYVKQIKNNVQKLKEDILIDLSNGTPLHQILNELQLTGAKEARARVNAMKLRAEAIKTGDAELVDAVISRKNDELRKMGLREIPNSPWTYKPHDFDGDDRK